ncbi:MAG: hypothetical protein FWF95_04095 [Syntrophorhabdaceae bacterium]|nr:hypothetical protein [Syntrophorhabdaceae bacterium]
MKTNQAETCKTDKTRYYRLIISAFLGVSAILLTALAISEIRNFRLLRQSEHVVEARVTDWRTFTKGGRRYCIRYTFVVDGAEASHADSTGRKNLWTKVPEDVWHKTKTTRTIDVRYVPDNIFNNIPVCMPIRFVNAYAAIGLGVMCFVMAVVMWICPWD